MYLIWILASYLLGSLPFGLWLGLAVCHIDLRTCGSGNIGASNAFRVLGWRVGLPAFLLDLLKGLIPVSFAKFATRHALPGTDLTSMHLSPELSAWIVVGCGFAAILGHNFSPFLGFRGGKGVATSLGVTIGLSWKAALAGCGIWALILTTLKYMSVASILGVPVGSFCIWLDNGRTLPYGIFAMMATLFAFIKHKSNIERLRLGTEPKFSIRK